MLLQKTLLLLKTIGMVWGTISKVVPFTLTRPIMEEYLFRINN